VESFHYNLYTCAAQTGNIEKYYQLQAQYKIASAGILTKIDSDNLYRDLVHRQKGYEWGNLSQGQKAIACELTNICTDGRKCVHSLLKAWPQRKDDGIKIGRSCLQRIRTSWQLYLLVTWRCHVCGWSKDDRILLQAYSIIDDEKTCFRVMMHIFNDALLIISERTYYTHTHTHTILYRRSCAGLHWRCRRRWRPHRRTWFQSVSLQMYSSCMKPTAWSQFLRCGRSLKLYVHTRHVTGESKQFDRFWLPRCVAACKCGHFACLSSLLDWTWGQE
jgi:hypothetical protein